VKNPGDVKLHTRLMQLWLRGQEVERAFEHAVSAERTLAFVTSSDWYECVLDVMQVCLGQGYFKVKISIESNFGLKCPKNRVLFFFLFSPSSHKNHSLTYKLDEKQ